MSQFAIFKSVIVGSLRTSVSVCVALLITSIPINGMLLSTGNSIVKERKTEVETVKGSKKISRRLSVKYSGQRSLTYHLRNAGIASSQASFSSRWHVKSLLN